MNLKLLKRVTKAGKDWLSHVSARCRYRKQNAVVAQRIGADKALPFEIFGDTSDDYWLWCVQRGFRHSSLRKYLPSLPDQTLQAAYTGAFGDKTLKEGFDAYRLFRNTYEEHTGLKIRDARVLDYGCGWGRIIRFFLKDCRPSNLFGVDHSEAAIEACEATNGWCTFELIEPEPRLPFDDGSFQLIYLYSVFSHLPEALHWSLLFEFHRLLSPGGILAATTRRRSFIERCEELRNDPELESKPDWLKISARAFPDSEASLAAYDRGEFCYDSLQAGGKWSFWGEACIPERYVRETWTRLFEICDYIDDPAVCRQNVIIARKPQLLDEQRPCSSEPSPQRSAAR